MGREIGTLGNLESRTTTTRFERDRAAEEAKFWRSLAEKARDAKAALDQAAALDLQLRRLAEVERDAADLEIRLRDARKKLDLARELEPTRQRRTKLPSRPAADAEIGRLQKQFVTVRETWSAADTAAKQAKELLVQTNAANAFTRVWKGLPKPETQTAVLKKAEERATKEERNLSSFRHCSSTQQPWRRR